MTATLTKLPRLKGSTLKLTRQFGTRPLKFLTENTEKYGRTFETHVAMRELKITSDPYWMKYILATHQKDFGRGYAYQILKLALGEGLLVNEGESWMRQRRLAQPAFYKKRLNELFYVMEEEGDKLIDRLRAYRGQNVPITDLFFQVTSDIVLNALLGGSNFEENSQVQADITEMQEYLVDRIRNPIIVPLMYINGRHRKFRQLLKRFDASIFRILEQRRNSGETGSDLLSMLMEARDEDTGEGMSDKQLRDELLTIYVAGHETSSYALSWTMYQLCLNPEAYDKVAEEARSIDDINHIGFEGLRLLPYINQTLMESMRLYPPAWIAGRLVKADHVIDGVQVKKDDPILLNIYSLHRDKEIWPDPERFDPDRFTPEAIKSRDKFSYVPFGAGPRMCIGNNFAIMEITMLLAKLFHHFDFELSPGQEIVPDPLITLRPKHGIYMKVKPRSEHR